VRTVAVAALTVLAATAVPLAGIAGAVTVDAGTGSVPTGAATTGPATGSGVAGGGGERVGHAERLAATQSSCSFPIAVTDATGTTVVVREEPDRVVTLAPSAAQTMWEIGAREKVVGVTRDADYLEGAESRLNVSAASPYAGPSVEKVIAADPDLVLVPNVLVGSPNFEQKLETLRQADIPTYVARIGTSLSFIRDKTERIGRLVGECDGADERAAEMDQTVREVRRAVEDRDTPDVLYVFFGFTAGDDTYIHELIETAGGNNLGAELNTTRQYYEVNAESVIQADPEWIVLNTDDPDGKPPQTAAYNSTTAVREGNVVVLDVDLIQQPAPRIVQPLETLAAALHPEAYPPADSTPTPEPDSDGSDGGGPVYDADDGDENEDEDGGAPGATGDGSTRTPSPSATPTDTSTSTRTGSDAPTTPSDTSTPAAEDTTADATPTSTPTRPSTTTDIESGGAGAAGSGSTDAATTASEGTTPGFGPVVALATLATLVVLGGRRSRD
jgi:iron complex transport system substrate-binding protein